VKEQIFQEDQKGIVPFPGEPEDELFKRAKECRNLRSFVQEKLQPFEEKDLASISYAEKAFEKTASLFHISPRWCPVFFSNKGLLPWHGACTWIVQLEKESSPTGFIQLKKGLAKGSMFFGMYKTEDILAHEFAHLGRLGFKEPRFEEVLACQVFKSSFRRIASTLFKRKIETLLFAFLLTTLLLFDILCFFLAEPSVCLYFFPLKLLPFAFLLLLALRSFWDAKVLRLAKEQVARWGVEPLPFLYRLTDKEISPRASSCTTSCQQERMEEVFVNCLPLKRSVSVVLRHTHQQRLLVPLALPARS